MARKRLRIARETLSGTDRPNSCSSDASLPLEVGAGSFELLQTMDDHVGAVGHVIFTAQGERLISCSADRTVVVRDQVTRQSGTSTSIASNESPDRSGSAPALLNGQPVPVVMTVTVNFTLQDR